RERLREELMLALCRAGRQVDALAAYRAARETFVEELGVEPGPELRALEQRILNQDDELFAPPPAAAVPRRQMRKLVTVLFADVVSATGEAVNVAARLQQSAAPGEIVLGAPTARLIGHAARLEPLGELALRGRPEPLAAFRLLDLPQAAPAFERRLDAPLVGREGELTRLHEAFALAVRERTLV